MSPLALLPPGPRRRSKGTGSASELARDRDTVPDGHQADRHTRIVMELAIELADRLRFSGVVALVDDAAVPQDIVHRDDAALAQQSQHALVVVGVVRFV